jgi:hypothetical protein
VPPDAAGLRALAEVGIGQPALTGHVQGVGCEKSGNKIRCGLWN